MLFEFFTVSVLYPDTYQNSYREIFYIIEQLYKGAKKLKFPLCFKKSLKQRDSNTKRLIFKGF